MNKKTFKNEQEKRQRQREKEMKREREKTGQAVRAHYQSNAFSLFYLHGMCPVPINNRNGSAALLKGLAELKTGLAERGNYRVAAHR